MKHATRSWMVLLAGLGVLASASQGFAADELAGGEPPFRVVGIDRDACAQIANYAPTGEADYKPGIAADGSTVAPADLDGGYGIEPRGLYHFPVKIEPFGSANSRFNAQTSLEIADVTIDPKTGRVTIDGQDVSGADRALADACAHLDDQPKD
ncbi:MAG: hypothetical protein WA943_12490 [Parvibaculum sp.]|uniref:hypothetical protein n=1 Tax=Parvibaculum sp. TaxID=2024848 RepID=UPI003C71BABD